MMDGLVYGVAAAGWIMLKMIFWISLIASIIYIFILLKIKNILFNQNAYFSHRNYYFWTLLIISSYAINLVFLIYLGIGISLSVSGWKLDRFIKLILILLSCLPNILFFNSIRKKGDNLYLSNFKNKQQKNFTIKIFILTLLSSFFQFLAYLFIYSIILVW